MLPESLACGLPRHSPIVYNVEVKVAGEDSLSADNLGVGYKSWVRTLSVPITYG